MEFSDENGIEAEPTRVPDTRGRGQAAVGGRVSVGVPGISGITVIPWRRAGLAAAVQRARMLLPAA
jgi:hypothetical protein